MDQNAEVLPGLDILEGRCSPAESDNTEHCHPLQHTEKRCCRDRYVNALINNDFFCTFSLYTAIGEPTESTSKDSYKDYKLPGL